MGLFDYVRDFDEIAKLKSELNEDLKKCKTVDELTEYKKDFYSEVLNSDISDSIKKQIIDDSDVEFKRKEIELKL